MENPTADDLFFEMWDRENRWIEEEPTKQEKSTKQQQEPTNTEYRLIEQWSRSGKLVAIHKSVKSVTSFKPIQDAITKCCDEGGGEVLMDCKPFTFRYKSLVPDNVYRKTYQKRNRGTPNNSDIHSTHPAPDQEKVSGALSATDNIFSMLFP